MNKIKKILIANRGEIVSRILKTCKEMGIATVAVFSEADKGAFYLKEADQSYYIGKAKPEESYLNMDKIIQIAKENDVDAIHPGYGFLAENAGFAKKCIQNNIIFIGSSPQIIENSGSKILSRDLVKNLDIPLSPGYTNDSQDIESFTTEAEKIGYPVIIKADLGGGGKGIKIAHNSEEIKEVFLSAKREALNSFGQDKVLMEKYFSDCRHIEFQIIADSFGNVIVLGERECSVQRKFQKIIEESPASNLSVELREQMLKASIKIAKALKYDGVGTIEFILDDLEKFYFMEINPRLQVEHPVTEMLTGIDIIKWQIAIAGGNKLSLNQEDIKVEGHAIECRICSENPEDEFKPSIGKVLDYNFPANPNIRIETGINKESEVDIFYDSMLAKIICHQKDRDSTILKLRDYLKSSYILGLNTNMNLLIKVLENNDFKVGKYNTSFLEGFTDTNNDSIELFLIASLLSNWSKSHLKKKLLKSITPGWRNNLYQYQTQAFRYNQKDYKLDYHYENNLFEVIINDSSANNYIVELLDFSDNDISFISNNQYFSFNIKADKQTTYLHNNYLGSKIITDIPRFTKKDSAKLSGTYKSPLPGEIVKIHVKADGEIKEGDPLITISSMKMENTIYADVDGTIEEIFVTEKSFIQADILLFKLKVEKLKADL